MEIKDFSDDGEKHHHHHHHHHNHSSRKEQKKRKWIRPAVVISIVVVVVVALALTGYIRSTETFTTEEKAWSNGNVELRYKDVSYQGEKYKYNNRITTILLAGIDSVGPIESTAKFAVAPRADTNLVLVIDNKNKKLSIIALNRDTMTKIHRYTFDGKDRGLFTDHLGYGFTYGDGGKKSCENLTDAVSRLLYDININHYIVINRDSISKISEIIGPVEVTVPNNDLKEIDPIYTEGNIVTIDSSNIELFIRKRDTSKDFSNTGRMARQNVYINGAMDRVLGLLKDDPKGVWEMIEGLENCLMTDISRNQYLDIINDAADVKYTKDDYYTPKGIQSAEGRYDEFYVDEDALLKMVVDLLYIKQI